MKAKEYKERVIKELGWTEQELKDDCFDYKTCTCDGRCQSCSTCPIAESFRSGVKLPRGDKLRALFFISNVQDYEADKWMEEQAKTPEFKKLVNDCAKILAEQQEKRKNENNL